MSKTETSEVRKHQNLEFRRWMIRIAILAIAGCTLVTIVSTMKELGLSGNSSINLGFAKIEVNSGQSEKLSSEQQQQLEQKAQQPQVQSFNLNETYGYCPYAPGSNSFPMYLNIPYGPSYQGYYVTAAGNGQFGVLDPYGTFSGLSIQTSGVWQRAISNSDVEVCADANGHYARFDY